MEISACLQAAARGLDIAREHLVADLDGAGVWQVGDKSRLES
jgi:hypothetical protein